MDKEAIKNYYTETQFEYGLVWNWMLKSTPALHFGYYDEKATNHQQAIIRANETLSEFAQIQPGLKIIDAGCGLGHSSEWLAENLKAHVTGITLVPRQVDTIKKRLQKSPVANVDFLVADYLHMPFADRSFDVVWAFESVCHAKEKLDFYKEAFRVLKPGGKVVMAEYIRDDRPMTASKELLLKQMFDAWAIPDLDTLDEHKNKAYAAGFTMFKNRDVTQNVLTSYRNLRSTCKRCANLSLLLYKTRIISAVRHNNMLASMKQADGLEQEVFTYQHIVAQK